MSDLLNIVSEILSHLYIDDILQSGVAVLLAMATTLTPVILPKLISLIFDRIPKSRNEYLLNKAKTINQLTNVIQTLEKEQANSLRIKLHDETEYLLNELKKIDGKHRLAPEKYISNMSVIQRSFLLFKQNSFTGSLLQIIFYYMIFAIISVPYTNWNFLSNNLYPFSISIIIALILVCFIHRITILKYQKTNILNSN